DHPLAEPLADTLEAHHFRAAAPAAPPHKPGPLGAAPGRLDDAHAGQLLGPAPGLAGFDPGPVPPHKLLQPLHLRLLAGMLPPLPLQPLGFELHGAAVGAGVLLHTAAVHVPRAVRYSIQ